MVKRFRPENYPSPESFGVLFNQFVKEGGSDVMPFKMFLSHKRPGIDSLHRRWEYFLQILRHSTKHDFHRQVMFKNWHWKKFDDRFFQITTTPNTPKQRAYLVARVYPLAAHLSEEDFKRLRARYEI